MARKKAKALPQPEPEMFTVYGDILQETEDAVFLRCDGEDVWLPKSQIQYEGECGDEYITVTLPDWLANDKGLSDNQGFLPPQSMPEEQGEATAEVEPTVTLFGRVIDQNDDAVVFLVQYGDEAGTEVEFMIPRENILSLIEGDLKLGEAFDEITLSIAYAVEAEIIEDPDYQEDEPGQSGGVTPQILRKHPDLKWLGEEQRTITQKLTEAEKAEYADEMAKLSGEIEELEDNLDSYRKSIKKQIDARESQLKSAAKIVREGREEREIFCDKVADYDSGEIKWADAVTGEVVDKRPMTAEESQLPLPMEVVGGRRQEETFDTDDAAAAADTPGDGEQECHTCQHGDGDGATDCRECRDCGEETFSSWEQASAFEADSQEPVAEAVS